VNNRHKAARPLCVQARACRAFTNGRCT
jgi:hypothetical protein